MTAGAKDQPQPLLSHLTELRWRLVRVMAAVVLGSIVGLVFANQITDILRVPCNACDFQAIAPAEEFSVLMKVAVFAGVFLGSPVILYQLWAFISPALTSRERKWAIPVVTASVVLFACGIAFGYWSLPKAFEFLTGIFLEVESNFRLGEYMSFVIRFLLAFGLSFLYPVFLFGAAAAGLVTSRQLARGRRWAVLLIVVAAAAITPTGDVLTLSFLSVPLYLFYETTYWLVRLLLRK